MGSFRLRDQVPCHPKAAPIIFEKAWQSGGISNDRKKANITSIFTNGKKEYLSNNRTIRLAPVCGKAIEQTLLEITVRYKMVTETSQNGFTKPKSSLSNPTAFHHEMTGFVDGERRTVVSHLL